MDEVVSLSTIAFSTVEVIDLVCSALDSADTIIDIISLTCRTCCAEIVDQIIAWFADTSSLDPIFIYCASRSAHSIATLATNSCVAVNTFAALGFLVIDLSFAIT